DLELGALEYGVLRDLGVPVDRRMEARAAEPVRGAGARAERRAVLCLDVRRVAGTHDIADRAGLVDQGTVEVRGSAAEEPEVGRRERGAVRERIAHATEAE